MKSLFFILSFGALLYSCSVSRQVSRQANELLIKDSAIASGHTGISIYEPAAGKYWYNYNADKNFIPSSNVKLFTLYAAMKHLGDSLVGARYNEIGDTALDLYPSGDPSFMHPDFEKQPVFNLLKSKKEIIFNSVIRPKGLGYGWAWDDYLDAYMTRRSTFPIKGNLLSIKWKNQDSLLFDPPYFFSLSVKTDQLLTGFNLIKPFEENKLIFTNGTEKMALIPFEANDATAIEILKAALKNINIFRTNGFHSFGKNEKKLHSQPTDSLLKPMMHRSDNFFAEQTLLMVSNETLGYMSDEAIINSLLKTDMNDLPQQPRWVDGSGLSRYNLATPKSLVQLLHKIKKEFSWDRITSILPTGGEGTLKNYFKDESGFIYAKTGTLSNNSALSGYLITKKNKLLIFSVLNNHYAGPATPVRRAVEKFLLRLREKY